jgi:hypothetical protein
MKKEATLKCKGLSKRPPMKKRYLENARGERKRHPRKKEAALKCKRLSKKTSDEKRDTPKMQGAK